VNSRTRSHIPVAAINTFLGTVVAGSDNFFYGNARSLKMQGKTSCHSKLTLLLYLITLRGVGMRLVASIKLIIKPARLVVIFLSALFFSSQALPAESDFPVAPNVRVAIDFWKKVYTEADTESGFLHDAQNLAVVYEKLDRNARRIDARRNEISKDLRVLASGKRSDLTPDQQRFLELWGTDVSNARLKEAATNIRWQLGQSDRFKEGLVRSGAYRKYIEDIARAKGVPVELAALPHVESSFHPGAQSSAAATGMWQFMRESAKPYMRVDALVDERLDPYKASYAALEVLKDNYEMLGTWPLALTAYNHGANGMARAVRDTGTRDIGVIISDYKGPRFGFASRNFYAQFMASLEVEQDAERYFGSLSLAHQPEFDEYEMSAYVDADVIASSLGIGLEDLRHDNPALQSAIWSGNKRIPKGYVLKVDKTAFNVNFVAAINSIPAAEFYSAQVPDVSYIVRRGDSLSVIASRYDTSVSELVAINQLRNRNALRIGQKIILPQQNGVIPTIIVSDTGERTAARPERITAESTYTIKRGDTISTIASRYHIPVATMLARNNMRSGNLIRPGQVLKLGAEDANQPVPAERNVAAQLHETLEAREQLARASLQNSGASQQNAVVDTVAKNTVAKNAPASANGAQAAVSTPSIPVVTALDPARLRVAADNTIEILQDETLGHYAAWLGVSSADLLRLNNLSAKASVQTGKRLKLDFAKVDHASFAEQRTQYHQALRAKFFDQWQVRDTENYRIKRSENVQGLARARSIPLWLFQQYNPAVNTAAVKAGQVVVFPVVEKIQN
jgi:membrane-bound lytic murein transglycosylase D